MQLPPFLLRVEGSEFENFRSDNLIKLMKIVVETFNTDLIHLFWIISKLRTNNTFIKKYLFNVYYFQNDFLILIIPGKRGVYCRRYICLSCDECRNLDFFNCSTEYCGPWKFHVFDSNQKTLKQLFFGDSNNLIMNILLEESIEHYRSWTVIIIA